MFTPEVIEGGRVDLLSQDVTDCGVSDHIRMKKSETESQQPKTHTHTHTHTSTLYTTPNIDYYYYYNAEMCVL